MQEQKQKNAKKSLDKILLTIAIIILLLVIVVFIYFYLAQQFSSKKTTEENLDSENQEPLLIQKELEIENPSAEDIEALIEEIKSERENLNLE